MITGKHISHLITFTSVAVLLLAGLVKPPALHAAEGDGGTRSIFSLGAGARGISLGKAFVSLADDASALYWNPAALRNVQSKQLTVMYMPVFGDFTDASYTYLGAVYPTLNAGSLGLSFMRIASTFDGYDADGTPTGEGEYSESQVMIGYAIENRIPFTYGSMALGVSFKIVNAHLSPYSSTAPGLDVGLRYVPDFARSLSFGANIQDALGAEHKLVQRTDRTYRTILTGIGYQKMFSNGTVLRIMLQMDFPELADREFHAGTELALSRYVAFRLGVDDDALTFGMGFNINAFDLDYGYLSKDVAGSSHPVSFSTRWGQSLFEQRTRLAEERAREERELVQNVLFERVKPHREQALLYESEGNIPLALDEWKIVLEYLPGDPEALEHIEEARRVMVQEQEKASRDLEKQTLISSHFTRGLEFYSGNDYTRARAEWQAILELDSTHAEARDYLTRTQKKIEDLLTSHHNAAVRYERDGRLTEAISEWNNIALLDPGDRRVEPAVKRIREKIENQNRDYRVTSQQLRVVNLYNHALQEYNRGEYSIAMSDLTELLELDPDHAEAKKLMAMARRKLTPLTRQEEERIRSLYLRGMQFYTQNDYRQAITEWEKILEIDPSNESVRRNIDEAKERIRKLGNNH